MQRMVADLQDFQQDVPVSGSWDDIRYFVVAAGCTSIRKAAEAMRTDPATVSRHISRLEKAVGLPLLQRRKSGIALTPRGEAALESGHRMSRASTEIYGTVHWPELSQAVVGISISQALGSLWMMRRIARFHREFPGIFVNVHLEATREAYGGNADFSMHLDAPEHPDSLWTRAGRLHCGLFASTAYVETFGMPVPGGSLAGHALVWDSMSNPDPGHAALLGSLVARGARIGISSSSATMNNWAVKEGIGIGLLPTFLAIQRDIPLVQIDAGNACSRDIWISRRTGATDWPEGARVFDWLRDSVDPSRFPWFRDTFVAPEDFGDIGID